MSHQTSPDQTSNDVPDFPFDFSNDDWLFSDHTMFPPNNQTILPSGGDPPPPLRPDLNNAIPSYGTSSSGAYSPGQVPYVFGNSNSAYNTPDTSFTPATFDTSINFIQRQGQRGTPLDFEAFDADNFDIWPQDMFEGMILEPGAKEGDTQRDASETMLSMSRQPATTSTAPATGSSHTPIPSPPAKSTRKYIKHHRRKSSTAKSKPKRSPRSPGSPSGNEGEGDRSSSSRINHNQIEKKYRTSMNDRYSVLQAALPESMSRSGEGKKKVGKADILAAALKYVRELEETGKELEAEKLKLTGSVGVWEGLWEKKHGV